MASCGCFFFQAKDGIRDAQESRGLGDVYKIQAPDPFLVNNNGPAGEYKSPDIQIRNELRDADPAWLNRPILVGGGASPVSYTHLTLPTISSV